MKHHTSITLLLCAHCLFFICASYVDSSPPGIDWSQWWTYDGISGPGFWGVINPEWAMCKDGRRQSPINIDPQKLLYDPNLTPFVMDKTKIPGVLVNTGHSVEWRTAAHDYYPKDDTARKVSEPTLKKGRQEYIRTNITGGPLSYAYTVTHARLHYGTRDTQGSEHLLDRYTFSGELQIYGFNSQLYRNFSQALGQVYGVVAVALLIKVGTITSPEFQLMLEGLSNIKFGDSHMAVPMLSMHALLPSTDQYMTYEGSLTEPGCYETVSWILPNKPIYISVTEMRKLRTLRQGKLPPLSNAPIANNFRPIQATNHRTIRTNININKYNKDPSCALSDPRLAYKAGDWLTS